ncbi:SH3 domain-containing protein [Acuticoccus sp. M5D2P5]|uniref:SH3 domain-containing protein n=1 Tax=Acuticoccus kalidii TaxID=2910977 RepID=UPI001EFF2CCE|nr:SH3 domain-containing protein [Acuticoccus kalidii]MCF3936013.1 SH3 domain-containing protein [Acuticoccus kalidii]
MKRIGFRGVPFLFAMLFAGAVALLPLAAPSYAADALERGASGLPLPRFVSLSSSEVNVRIGPSFNHKVVWTYTKSGLPVEVIREFGNWRQVRDAEGDEGWVHQSLLSGRRTVLVSPWSQNENVPLRAEAKQAARPTAYLEPYVLGNVNRCDGSWCEISGRGWRGQVPQSLLWGVYPREEVD